MADTSGIFSQLSSPGGSDDSYGLGRRYREAAEQEHGDRMAAAMEVYRGATDASEARGVQLRSEGFQPHLTAAGGGSALAARAAIGGMGQQSVGAGSQAAQLGSRDRLRAAGGYVDAQTQRAAYEQALMDQYIGRREQYQQARQREMAAQQAIEQSNREMVRQIIGSGVSAAGSAVASMGGARSQQPSAAQQGAYYGQQAGAQAGQRAGQQVQQQQQGYDPYADYYTHYGDTRSF